MEPAAIAEKDALIKELAGALEDWIEQHYTPAMRKYPSEEQKYQLDMGLVRRARAKLSGGQAND